MDNDAFHRSVAEHHDKFYRMVGHCVTQWANVDESLFDLCHICLATTPAQTSLVFYKSQSISDHKVLTGNLLDMAVRDDKIMHQRWSLISTMFDKLVPFRNFICHNPVRGGAARSVLPGGDGAERVHISIKKEIYIKSSKLYNKRQLPQINKATLNDLHDHYESVEKMQKEIWKFVADMREIFGNGKDRPGKHYL